MIKGLNGFKIINSEGFIPNPVYIYTLNCPISNEPKYVGITINPKHRYQNHICAYNNTKKDCWIKSLKSKNLKPIMQIISIVSKDLAENEEIKLIKEYKQKYPNLKNLSNGGYGPSGSQNKGTKIIGKSFLTGEIKYYNKIRDVKKDGFNINSVQACVRNITKQHQNFVWCYLKEEDLLDQKINKLNNLDPRSKPIYGINDKNEKIEFSNMAIASKNGFSHGNIIRSIKTGIKSKGYYWFYV